MNVIVRFAPSPTGYLHVGNVRMALINYLLAMQNNGSFILRIDDTDVERSTLEFEEAIKEDLNWLGINYNYTFKQSSKISEYKKYMKLLIDAGRLYPCYETKEELEYKKKLQLAKGKPPIYDRSMLKLTEAEKQKYEKEGRKPHYRFKIDHKEITWNDLIKGEVKFHGSNISDPVLVKENGTFLFTLSSVVDDIESSITHIIRGEDHLSNTAVHVQLFEFFNKNIPNFGHLPLISTLNGEDLSKRTGAMSIRGFRNLGIEPRAILNYLFSLGKAETNEIYMSFEEMLPNFHLDQYSNNSAKFDNNKLYQINSLILKNLPYNEALPQIKQLHLPDISKDFWNTFKCNISSFLDLRTLFDKTYGSAIKVEINNKDLIQIALNTLPAEPWDNSTWNFWIENIKTQTNLRGKNLFHPLRLAITGSSSGPELKELILLIGYKRVKERLLALL